eukprot:59894-Rhodomonas_salina.1
MPPRTSANTLRCPPCLSSSPPPPPTWAPASTRIPSSRASAAPRYCAAPTCAALRSDAVPGFAVHTAGFADACAWVAGEEGLPAAELRVAGGARLAGDGKLVHAAAHHREGHDRDHGRACRLRQQLCAALHPRRRADRPGPHTTHSPSLYWTYSLAHSATSWTRLCLACMGAALRVGWDRGERRGGDAGRA